MIYLNNAATSYPKPDCVKKAVQACVNDMPASRFRGAAWTDSVDIVEGCREKVGKLLGISQAARIFFTSGATEALNTILGGLGLEGDILVTQTEHNSVLRPLMNQGADGKLRVRVVPCEKDGAVTEKMLEQMVTSDAKVLVVNHCSNVTGMVQDMEMFGRFARKYGLFLVADVSQSAGCLPVYADQWGVDALAFTGHKSLLGIQGTGGFYIRPDFPLRPLKYGGTGANSSLLTYKPDEYEYEAGTQNLPGIAALYAGVNDILERGIPEIVKRERGLMKKLYEGLAEISGIRLYGNYDACEGPVLSLNFHGLLPSDGAYILWNAYGIVVRTGLHCSPLIHQAMGTEAGGTIRVSISCFTTEEEIDFFLGAVKEIAASLSGVEANDKRSHYEDT